MFNDLKIDQSRPVYLQIKDYLKELIFSGLLQAGMRLPSTRELSAVLQVSRNTVIQAYQYLEDDGFIRIIKGQGAFIAFETEDTAHTGLQLDWEHLMSKYALMATELDVEKKELKWKKGMLSFKSIAPDPELFELEDVKRAFLNRLACEGKKLLNYGYAQGYKPLLEYLQTYMKNKGVKIEGKALLITNGFTEGLNLVIRALTKPGDQVICENPTHNTALKIMRLSGLEIKGIPMSLDGLELKQLEACLDQQQIRFGFLIPSYHNPTGLVMSPEKRQVVLEIFQKYRVPIVEDGFNEELRYSGAHVAPLIALAGESNNVIYIGSFSKILFPGIRVGWIMADERLIAYLESIKRAHNIHTSSVDQGLLYEYLQDGRLDKYLKKVRRVYRQRHQMAVALAKTYIPDCRVWGEGGLHIFIELALNLNARQVLDECYRQGVVFMPGDIFFTDRSGENTFRLSISRVTPEMMETGFKIIGDVVKQVMKQLN